MSDTTEIEKQVKRRRTFAIISHPDAGKTTLTEKLLLFSGAIQIAGSVKARKAARHATSDWMEIEKQRGISVASSVMQMEYRDCVINLLDTPGHQDFSEDTYRVLTAVDAALMVIDAANGVEPQTRRLLQVCRARNTPILTFVNKMDREVQDPMSVMDEIEQELGMTVVPFTWPVGMGKLFHGVYDRREKRMRVFSPGEDKAGGEFTRGMRLKVVRSGKELRPNTVVSFMSQRRELLDTAFAGDIIGIPNHGVLQLGDTLSEGEALQFTGLPFFAPEMFRAVEVADPLRSKQLRAGLTQLGEEGAIQVFRPIAGSVLLLGAVGQLQFEVVAHRLEHEYGVKARIMASNFNLARWVTSEDPQELKKFMDANAHRVALDAVDAPTLLVDHSATLRAVEQQWPKIKFHALREHAGLVFQAKM